MSNYCDSGLYEIDFDERKIIEFLERGEHIVDVLRDQRARDFGNVITDD
jgi:hypothetical protein